MKIKMKLRDGILKTGLIEFEGTTEEFEVAKDYLRVRLGD